MQMERSVACHCRSTVSVQNLNENTSAGAWRPSSSRSCSPTRASTTCHDKIDGWDTGIEKHIGGTPLAPSSHFKITEHHRHNLYRCCS